MVHLLLLLSLQAQAAIFGADNRHPVTAATASQINELARSTAIAVLSSNMTVQPNGTIDLDTDKMTKLCKDESIYNATSLSYSCTGFLVAPDLLVTAGHCVYAVNTPTQTLEHEKELACKAFAWLFDYREPVQSKGIDPAKLFHCSEIIYARQTEKAPFLDYALIRLDRPAFGRAPFAISHESAAVSTAVSTPVAMMGYPFGTAVTYTDSARVTLNNSARDSFLTSLDAFEGNSGSPVFNTKNEIVGILIGGTPSLNTIDTHGCEKLNRCTENGSQCLAPDTDTAALPGYQGVGSEVQRIQPILDLISGLRHSL